MSEEELNKITWEEYKRLIEESEITYNELQEANKEIERLQEDIGNYVNIVLHDRKEIERLHSIIKEVKEYITSYESISIIQGLMKEYSNYDLDIKTMNEMIRRYMVVHDEILKILDKENN